MWPSQSRQAGSRQRHRIRDVTPRHDPHPLCRHTGRFRASRRGGLAADIRGETPTMSVFVLPLSRILLSLLFAFTGYATVFGYGPADKPVRNMAMWIDQVKGLKIPGTNDPLPNPELLAQIAAYGELVGGIMLFFGILSRLTALGLLVFTILASVLGHAFWTFADPAPQLMQIGNFVKNMGVIGGLLVIVGAGGGAVGIDGMFR